MLFNRILWTYGGLFALYVLVVNITAHPVIFSLSFLAYAGSLSLRLPRAAAPWVQLALLVCMQAVGNYYNSALPLYLLTLAKHVYVEESRARVWVLSLAYTLACLIVSIGPIATRYSLLVLLFFVVGIAFHFVIAAYLGRLSHMAAKRTDRLQEERARLSKQDALTGLCNYDECHRRLEQLLQSEKLRVVGELASGMAHEIRNPLTTIKGFMQIARANGYNIEPWYGLIMSEIDRMSELTAEFLQFSKPHSARYQVLPLQVCILKAVSLTESEAARLGHVVRSELPDEPLCVLMDPDKMVQLLLNLIKNACEAIARHGQIDIRLSRRDHLAVLEVQDNGAGMSSDMLEQIFNPFYTTKETGTGLGLAICHKIVQDHQGSMEVESAVNSGTRFILTLPVSPAPAAEHHRAAYG